MQLTVQPLEGREFGCRIENVQLSAVSDEDFNIIARAFLSHHLVVLPGCAGLVPENEAAFYRRLEALWDLVFWDNRCIHYLKPLLATCNSFLT